MSISEIVDAEYRLQPADLADRPMRVVISNVTYQGVEQLAPVLHFDGMTKRLVLSPDLVRRLVNLSGTPIFSKWIGITVVLEASRIDGAYMIGITAAENSPYPRFIVEHEDNETASRRLALVIVGVIALLGLLVAFSSMPQVESLFSRVP